MFAILVGSEEIRLPNIHLIFLKAFDRAVERMKTDLLLDFNIKAERRVQHAVEHEVNLLLYATNVSSTAPLLFMDLNRAQATHTWEIDRPLKQSCRLLGH
jgi:uncharacterized membrane protein